MLLSTLVGVVLALVAICLMLARSRAENPAITRAVGKQHRLKGVAWVLILHPAILFLGFCAYMGSLEMNGTGVPGVAAWGVLWPLAVEVSSMGHPCRVARLLRAYADNKYVLPLTKDHRRYRRMMKPLRATETKLFLLIVPVVAAGIMLTGLFSEPF